MRIQHNIAALNSHRNLTNNNSAVAKNLEKLSSGYRINRAGDDAAGLAISEKMRAQITGLETAQKNAQDGISLVQTAEGALTEVHSMLNRMVELADQSANGTYDNEVDRANLQKEIDSLKSEIDRISKATNFNGIKLLDGSIGSAKGLEAGTTDAIDGSAIGKAFSTTADAINGVLTEGAAATKAKDEFYMPGELQVSHDENASAAGELTFKLKDKNNNEITIKLTGNTTANGEKSTFTMDEIVNAIATGTTGNAVTVTNGTITVTETGNGDLAKMQANYEFSFKDNKLVATAKAEGDGFGSMTLTDLTVKSGTAGGGAEDIKAMTDQLHNDLDADSTSDKIGLGDVTSQGVEGKDAVPGRYVVGSVKVTLNGDTDLHGQALKVGDKTYVMQAQGQALDAELQALVDNGDVVAVKFDSTTSGDGMKALANAINANKGTTNLQAVIDGNDLQISETEAYGNGILGGNGNKPINMTTAVGVADITVGGVAASKQVTVSDDLTEGNQVTIGNKTYQFLSKPADAVDGKFGVQFTDGNARANAQALLDAVKADFVNAKLSDDGKSVILGDNEVKVDASSKGLSLQVGDTSDSYQKVSVVVKSTSTASLGIDGIDISTQEGAAAAIDKIKAAINTVSSTRGDLGAVQNRLEHTINNLSVTTENMTAAESRIRDVDMAKEMMAYTKNNILVQASQAMLAQANQLPQGVLQLLQ